MLHYKLVCSRCGNRAVSVTWGNYGLEDLGIPIVLKGIELVCCSACGNQDPVIPDLEGLIAAMMEALASRPTPPNDREESFPRKYPVRSAG